jgi:hypothetical protein
MKKMFFSILSASILLIAACNDNTSADSKETSKTENKAAENNNAQSDTDINAITPTFASVDGKVKADLKTIVDHYLHIKNALAKDNASEAANGGKALAETMNVVNKSLLSADQKKIYEENEEDLREHAEHISKNANNIAHQREHFSQMSEDMYALAKAFGGGQTLYHAHCPMYNDNKGAMWLSEAKAIKNPYFGSEMLECGSVKEKIN